LKEELQIFLKRNRVLKTVRNSAKAIIIADGRLLAVRNVTAGVAWYLLPGGGQNHGETLVEALERECTEEASIEIEVGDIVFVRDYISMNHEFAEEDNGAHQVEFMFQCSIKGNKQPVTGTVADKWQTGVEWLPLNTLHEYSLYPSQLKELLSHGIPRSRPVYLGDVN
jgi:ADP-ribose pyrophosphatase YjhB (NUDIX family)